MLTVKEMDFHKTINKFSSHIYIQIYSIRHWAPQEQRLYFPSLYLHNPAQSWHKFQVQEMSVKWNKKDEQHSLRSLASPVKHSGSFPS